MILLRQDCLVFKKANGEGVPGSAKEFAVDVIGEALGMLDEEVVKNAAEAVLHYFKEELGRNSITIGEFSTALEETLRKLGYDIKSAKAKSASKDPGVLTRDLREIASQSGIGYELLFFSLLRDEVRDGLGRSPQILRFLGLRKCVKHLLGVKKWNGRCQTLSDQIVEYLRTCMEAEKEQASCSLLVF
jgi:hypothetical protein